MVRLLEGVWMQFLRPPLKIKYVTYGYLLILLIGTLIPLGPMNTTLNDNYTLNIRWDYLIHVLVYMPFPYLIWLYQKRGSLESDQPTGSKVKFWLLVILVPLITASLFEAMQIVLPYRRFNINDMLAGGIGGMIGLILIPVFRKLFSWIKWI